MTGKDSMKWRLLVLLAVCLPMTANAGTILPVQTDAHARFYWLYNSGEGGGFVLNHTEPDAYTSTDSYSEVYVWYRTRWDSSFSQYKGYTNRGYLAFDLSGIDDSAVITSATLWLNPTVANLSDGIEVWRVGDSWGGTAEDLFWLLDKGWDTYLTSAPGNTTLDWIRIDLLAGGFWDYASDLADDVLSLALTNGREFEDPNLFASSEESVGEFGLREPAK